MDWSACQNPKVLPPFIWARSPFGFDGSKSRTELLFASMTIAAVPAVYWLVNAATLLLLTTEGTALRVGGTFVPLGKVTKAWPVDELNCKGKVLPKLLPDRKSVPDCTVKFVGYRETLIVTSDNN